MRHPLFALVLFSALPASAQEAPRLIAALAGDWNGDGLPDAVTIHVDAEGVTDLTLHAGDSTVGLRPEITLHDVVWSGTMAGTLPTLAARSDSSFAVLSEQSAIGRSPWQQTLTIAYRDGSYVVAGFDYATYDRIDPDHSGSCSVNLLTGRYELRVNPEGPAKEQSVSGQGADRAFPLAALTAGYSPDVCAPAYE